MIVPHVTTFNNRFIQAEFHEQEMLDFQHEPLVAIIMTVIKAVSSTEKSAEWNNATLPNESGSEAAFGKVMKDLSSQNKYANTYVRSCGNHYYAP